MKRFILSLVLGLLAVSGLAQPTNVSMVRNRWDTAADTNTVNGGTLTNLPSSSLVGTLPNGVFPATYPAGSGANLTALSAANISGILPVASGGRGVTNLYFTNTAFADLNGNDSTAVVGNQYLPFLGLSNAMVAVPSNGVVKLASGEVFGSDAVATITSYRPKTSFTLDATGAIISNSVCAQLFTFTNDFIMNGGSVITKKSGIEKPFAWGSNTDSNTVRTATFNRVNLDTLTDGFFFSQNYPLNYTANQCYIMNHWDIWVDGTVANSMATNSVYNFNGGYFICTNANDGVSALVRMFQINSGTWNFNGVTMICTNSQSAGVATNFIMNIQGTGTVVTLAGCRLAAGVGGILTTNINVGPGATLITYGEGQVDPTLVNLEAGATWRHIGITNTPTANQLLASDGQNNFYTSNPAVLSVTATNGITDNGPTTNSPAVFVNHLLTNAPAGTDGQLLSASSATAGGVAWVNAPQIVMRIDLTNQSSTSTQVFTYTTPNVFGGTSYVPWGDYLSTTAGSGGSVGVTIGWIDDSGGGLTGAYISSAALTLATPISYKYTSPPLIIHCGAGTVITNTINFNSPTGSPVWQIHAGLIRVL